MVAGLQTADAQGFRVYQSDGTQLQFSLKTDSIVFDNGLSGDEVFGPFTPVNLCIARTWYKSKSETVTFRADGTTDYIAGGTYEFMPYQGNVIIYNTSGAPVNVYVVHKITTGSLIMSQFGDSDDISVWTRTQPSQLVTSIVLSETSITLKPDEVKTLTATIFPEDADNPAVTWESSNEDVAEVNKNGRVIANANGQCVITCRATDGSGVKAECQVSVNNLKEEAERTVIVYMAGDNSLSSLVKQDTTEMAMGKDVIPNDVNFIIYVDDKQSKSAIYELSREKGMQLWKQFDEEQCSTDSLTMLTTLQDIEHYFPARHYGITFWSHATGWVPRRKAFGKDETPGTASTEIEMEIPVLRDVLAQLPRFDYIFFDACFMQCIEVAYELRNVTDYMVGSPAEIPGPGAPYDKIMEALCKGDAKGIVGGYDSAYPGTYGGYYYPGVLLSCIDCSQLESLAEATGQFLTPFYMERTEPPSQDYQFYCNVSYEKFTYCFDMRTTMHCLLSEEDYAAWMEAFDKAVPLRTLSSTNRWFAVLCNYSVVKDPDNYGGVSMFVPMEKYNACGWNEDFKKISWYEAAGWETTGW